MEGVAISTDVVPTVRLRSLFTETVGYYSNPSTDPAKVRLRSTFIEAVSYFSNTTTDPKKTRLRSAFIEVIANAPNVSMTQEAVEVIRMPSDPSAQVTQLASEVLYNNVPQAQVTQLAVEVLSLNGPAFLQPQVMICT